MGCSVTFKDASNHAEIPIGAIAGQTIPYSFNNIIMHTIRQNSKLKAKRFAFSSLQMYDRWATCKNMSGPIMVRPVKDLQETGAISNELPKEYVAQDYDWMRAIPVGAPAGIVNAQSDASTMPHPGTTSWDSK